MRKLLFLLMMTVATMAYADGPEPPPTPVEPPPIPPVEVKIAEPIKDPEEPPAKDKPPAKVPEGDPPKDEPPKVEDEPSDLVAKTMAENAKLEADIEALKSADNDVFEQNAILKAEFEDAKKLAEVELENADLKSKLEGIKRDTITASLGLSDKQKAWADSLNFQQLEEYAEMMPRRKTILDEKNEAKDTDVMTDFKKTVNVSRIH